MRNREKSFNKVLKNSSIKTNQVKKVKNILKNPPDEVNIQLLSSNSCSIETIVNANYVTIFVNAISILKINFRFDH